MSERNVETGEKRPVSGLRAPTRRVNRENGIREAGRLRRKAEGWDPAGPSLTFDFLVLGRNHSVDSWVRGPLKSLENSRKTEMLSDTLEGKGGVSLGKQSQGSRAGRVIRKSEESSCHLLGPSSRVGRLHGAEVLLTESWWLGHR